MDKTITTKVTRHFFDHTQPIDLNDIYSYATIHNQKNSREHSLMNDLLKPLRMPAPLIGIILLALLFYAFMVTSIPAGYVGIQVLFGKVESTYLEPGIHIVNPFMSIVKMDTRTQKADEEGIIPSKEMLNMTLKTSINYHVDAAQAAQIYKTLGSDYYNSFVDPHIRSIIREVTSDYSAEQFFSNSRNEIQQRIQATLTKALEPRGIIVESVMLKEISPPDVVRNAIELKQAQQQEAEAMQFKLQKERLEAERKMIEAEGIQKFQEIVKKGIDKNLLDWKGIEATETIAKSPNTKIVIIGNKDSGGLPLILPAK